MCCVRTSCTNRKRKSLSCESGAAIQTAKWWNWPRSVGRRDTQNVVPTAACEFNSRLGYFAIQFATTMRMGQCPAEPHKLGLPGATPGSATEKAVSNKRLAVSSELKS